MPGSADHGARPEIELPRSTARGRPGCRAHGIRSGPGPGGAGSRRGWPSAREHWRWAPGDRRSKRGSARLRRHPGEERLHALARGIVDNRWRPRPALTTTSTVRSSSVGPSPPEQITTSARDDRQSQRTEVISVGIIATTGHPPCGDVEVPQALAARYDEFVSTISPRHSSSPIVKISACMRGDNCSSRQIGRCG